MGRTILGSGLGLGTIMAIIISWSLNHSIVWAMVHGFLGWIYILYYALVIKG